LTNNHSASKKSTTAAANATVPGDIANVKSPKKREVKKKATKTASPSCCNPKRKKDLDEGTVDWLKQYHQLVHGLNSLLVWFQRLVWLLSSLGRAKTQYNHCVFITPIESP
jgi:hypothetical protein